MVRDSIRAIMQRLHAPSLSVAVAEHGLPQRTAQGQFVGTIPTDDARRYPHTLTIAWLLGEGKLRGWIAAVATDIPVSGAVSSYAALTRP